MCRRILVSLLLPFSLPACMAVNPSPPLSSTQGVTLVETGEVIAIDTPVVPPGTAASQARLTVRMANGTVRSYAVDGAPGFRVGDRIDISSNRGKSEISRQ